MERMFELLTDLTIDPFKQEAFRRDPAAFLKDAGVTPEEAALLSELGAAPAESIANGAWARCAGCVDPGPDPFPDPDPGIHLA